MDTFLLKNGKIFNGERFFAGDILIENEKIAAIGENIDLPTQAIVIDCTDCIITSGLVDIHVHFLEMGNEKFGFPADLASIPFGVTYAVDVCAEQTDLSRVENLAVETKVFVEIGVKDGELDVENVEKKLTLYGDRAIGLKAYFDDSLGNGFTFEHLIKACEFARKRGLKMMVHCSYSPSPMIDIVKIFQKGDIITHAYHGGYHTIEENDYQAFKQAKAKGVIIDAGMAGGVHTDFAVLKRALEQGFEPDVISSDITKFSAFKRGGIYGLPMCMSIMKLLGLSEEKVFKAVTKSAASAVGQEDWFGLKIGNGATMSLLKWENTPISIVDGAGNRVESAQGYVCKLTMKNGKILYRN